MLHLAYFNKKEEHPCQHQSPPVDDESLNESELVMGKLFDGHSMAIPTNFLTGFNIPIVFVH
eukprot:scaffold50556_cov72-Attheya_sp.AAC.4